MRRFAALTVLLALLGLLLAACGPPRRGGSSGSGGDDDDSAGDDDDAADDDDGDDDDAVGDDDDQIDDAGFVIVDSPPSGAMKLPAQLLEMRSEVLGGALLLAGGDVPCGRWYDVYATIEPAMELLLDGEIDQDTFDAAVFEAYSEAADGSGWLAISALDAGSANGELALDPDFLNPSSTAFGRVGSDPHPSLQVFEEGFLSGTTIGGDLESVDPLQVELQFEATWIGGGWDDELIVLTAEVYVPTGPGDVCVIDLR
jgi:hypothetical protein